MNDLTPGKLSFYASILLVIIFSVFYLVGAYFVKGQIETEVIFSVSPFLFISSFFLIRFFVKKFIYEKIRLIYKTIHNLKLPEAEKKFLKSSNSDLIRQSNLEVVKWANGYKQQIEDLKKLEAYRREFLGNISHELKTPIFNIQGYVLTLLDGGLEDPRINQKYLQRTEQSINRMISIIEDLETISRYEAGELRLEFSNFDIVALSADAIEFVEIKAADKNIKLNLNQKYESPVFVSADSQKVQQVLINLLINSIKYGKENGRTKISFFDMDENILVEVTDNGIGIPREELPRIFERFYRADRSRTRQNEEGGSGLGLAIVKHVIEAHNQTINVRSTPGVGTTFAFTLKKGKASGSGLL